MRMNKDHLVGFVVAVVVLLVIWWGVWVTTQVRDVVRAHNNLVGVLAGGPVVPQRAAAPRPSASAMPAPTQPTQEQPVQPKGK